MKRLLLRIGALGTVVALGFIAIAQAQRGSVLGFGLGEADENAAAQTRLDEGEPPAIGSLGGAPTRPGHPLRGTVGESTQPREHPLRSNEGNSVALSGENVPADPFSQNMPPGDPLPPQRIGARGVMSPEHLANERAPLILTASGESPISEEGAPLLRDRDENGRRVTPELEAERAAFPDDGASPTTDTPHTPVADSIAPFGTTNENAIEPRHLDSLGPMDNELNRAISAAPELPEAGTPAFTAADDPMDGHTMAEYNRNSLARPTVESMAEPMRASDPSPATRGPARGPALDESYATDPTFRRSAADHDTVTAGQHWGDGMAQPGDTRLEGPQAPHLVLEKIAPREIQVGRPATFQIRVRNTGTVAATGVEIHDRIPAGTRLLGTSPQALAGDAGELIWTFKTLAPGKEHSVEVQLEPLAEGEIGSVATVRFSAEASARSLVTQPKLAVQTEAPSQVLVGEQVTLAIRVSNPGSGKATNVILTDHLPRGLSHPTAADIEYVVGDLAPGESRDLKLTLTAEEAGLIENVLVAHGDGDLHAKETVPLEITSPLIEVGLVGPKRRYLEREATYQLTVSNPGTASAKQIELVAHLPRGLEFVRANNLGHYDKAERAVYWRLEELPANDDGTVELVTMPVEAGTQEIRLRGTTARGLADEARQPIMVEGIAALLFQVADVTDPIEVGGSTTYEVRVVNQGSKAATDVVVAVDLPAGLDPIDAKGPTRHAISGSRVLFESLPHLAPKADTTYFVRVRGLRAGDLRTQVQVTTDEMASPVTKEESTHVYADQ